MKTQFLRYALLISALSVLLWPFCLQASEEAAPQFFTALRDVPLMQGLHEVPEMTVIFDKPDGRIIEAAAAIEQLTEREIKAFYASALPQLGWRKSGENAYRRQGEELLLAFESADGARYMRVTVQPEG